jgi:Type II CAAX prenyl endopeptidase Rce1-like
MNGKSTIRKHVLLLAGVICIGVGMVAYVLWSPPETSFKGSVRFSPEEAVHVAELSIQGQVAQETFTQSGTPLVAYDWQMEHFLASALEGAEDEYYTKYGLPGFTYVCNFVSGDGASRVSVTVDAYTNTVVGWHKDWLRAPESEFTDAGASEARARAFLTEQGIPSDVVMLEDQLVASTSASVFTYRRIGSEVESVYGVGYLTYRVGVSSGEVTEFARIIHTPPAFTDTTVLNEQRTESVDMFWSVVNLALLFAAIFYLYRFKTTGWVATSHISKVLGVSLLILILLEGLNAVTVLGTTFGASTSTGYVFAFLGFVAISIVMYCVPSIVFLVAGVALYKQIEPQKEPLLSTHTKGVVPALIEGTSKGYIIGGIAVIVMGLISLVDTSIMANDSPKDLAYLIATVYPAFSVFSIVALIPALTEEIAFRLFSFALFTHLSKSRAVGATVATVIWILPHVELLGRVDILELVYFSVVGALFAFAFLRYDLLTAVVAHFVLNSVLGVVFVGLIFALKATILWSALLIALLPAIIGVVVYLVVKYTRKDFHSVC